MTWSKFKEWVNEHAPMLANVYENKYVGMGYDRFASLPAQQQKQIIIGSFALTIGIIFIYLGSSYLSLWSFSRKSQSSNEMINMLMQYQKQKRDKSTQSMSLERNSQLSPPGAIKQHLIELGRGASISPRMVQVDEKEPSTEKVDDSKNARDVKLKHATLKLQRINLNQLKTFLNNLEHGQYNLSISSMKITNDDKIRGYMNVELAIVAYLFESEEGA